MRPINDADRKVANIHTDAFEPFVYPDGLALGDGVLQLDTGIPLGTGFHVYKMPPGMTSRSHRHIHHQLPIVPPRHTLYGNHPVSLRTTRRLRDHVGRQYCHCRRMD